MPIAPAKVKNQFSARPRKIVRKLVPIPGSGIHFFTKKRLLVEK
jgi:hypothetical protein